MPVPSIAVIVGSLRKASINAALARALIRLAGERLEFQHVEIGDLPLFSQDLEADLPAAVKRVKGQIEASDGLLIVTPEYNRGIPGVLKNAIDWASRPYGKSSFPGKPVGIAGTSPGTLGTAVAQAQLRGVLAALDCQTMALPELYLQNKEGLIAPDGTVSNEGTAKFLSGYVDRYIAFIERWLV